MQNINSQTEPISIMLKRLGSCLCITASLFFGLVDGAFAQEQYKATTAEARAKAYQIRQDKQLHSPIKAVPFKNIGPTVMNGRITDLDVNPANPTEFYVSYASGGLWYSNTNGIDFNPLFQDQATMTIGDIAVDWEHSGGQTIWLGSGENNSSRSSYAGNGIYLSKDGGKTWEHKGLAESQHIGRIIIDPNDPNTVTVAALGHLYSNNDERGIYKTTDGGNTWKRVLNVNERTGIIDLVVDPKNPSTMYASSWERIRYAWDFVGNGEGTAIYKSTDKGDSWTKVSGGKSGFPESKGIGRIGLAVAPSNPNVVYALLDNQDHRPKEESEKHAVTKDKLRKISTKDFLSLKDTDINDFLDRHNFPRDFNAVDIKEEVKAGKYKAVALVEYLEDANAMLFDSPIKGLELYKSTDGGKTWANTHVDYIEGLGYTYGYYFGEVRVSPTDENKVYALGVPIIRSDDGGKSWKTIDGPNVHSDHHALWINPNNPKHLINGNDGGLNISYDDGNTWLKCNTPAAGQFYSVAVDNAKPYNVYGGLQDNGVWYAPHNYTPSRSWYGNGSYAYKNLMGGDGMQVAIDTRNNDVLYTGYQFGNYYKINKATGERNYITPKHKLGERPLRWNWESPIMVSPHNQDIVYFGSNRFHRSMNQGADFETLSDDLTQGGKKGNVPYGTLTSISESPLRFGLIYVGSDDGYIHISKDAGQNWERISDNLPQDLWVSTVVASAFVEGRVYASLNGYRFDHFDSYVYVSNDYGKNWTKIGADLPTETVNVIKEDPNHQHILYVGTDHSLYISLDEGRSFEGVSNDFPDVAVHDVAVQARDKDLVVATHGRSLWLVQLEDIYTYSSQPDVALDIYEVESTTFSSWWGRQPNYGDAYEPEMTFTIQSAKANKGELKITSDKGTLVYQSDISLDKGLNYIDYNLAVDKKVEKNFVKEVDKDDYEAGQNGTYYLAAGTYTVEVKAGGKTVTTTLKVNAPRQRPQRKAQKKTP